MPRKYTKKTKTKYNIKNLKLAVKEVKNKKLTLGQASKKYSIPKTTIYDQLKKGEYKVPQKGRRPVFNNEQEKKLVNYIMDSCKIFYGITITSLRKIAYDFAVNNKVKHNFNRNTHMMGMDWYYSFISRHSNIPLRKPESTSLDRIMSFNEFEVNIFFKNLKKLQKKYNFRADSIYNVDETVISNVHRNSKISAPKGLKQVAKATSGEGGIMTVICAFNANGTYIPPMFIFKRKKMTGLLMKGCNNNMIATVSDSGWINESIFVNWLHHLIYHAKPSKKKPILLIFDNHQSHISLESCVLYRNYGIHALSLPPHASHMMQPLDLTFFGPLKSSYNKECELYMANNPGKQISQYDVSGLFTKAFNRTANIDKAVNGFKAAGIFPVDSDKFNDLFVHQKNAFSRTDDSISIRITTKDASFILTSFPAGICEESSNPSICNGK